MFVPVIGLEIHTRLKTKTKMFCRTPNDSDEHHPNVNVCPVCAGHPGTLPVINKQAVEYVIKVGYALGSEIAEISKFDRKNYFYPDLPKGYQISQYDKPFCKGGALAIGDKTIKITRVHLEEDTGKLIHKDGENASLVDLNRAGSPLMELVTEPDIRSAGEAKKFCEELQLLLRYLGVSNADMEKGEMRCEANISLAGEDGKFGTKVEVKNLNSFKSVERAIEYETERQRKVFESGEKVIQETRGWDENKGETFSQRLKEEAHDYRYFPEPDLPELDISKLFDLEKIRLSVPELPSQKRLRFERDYCLPAGDIDILIKDRELSAFFENVASELDDWIANSDKSASRRTDEEKLKAVNPHTINSQSQCLVGERNFGVGVKLAANYLLSDLQSLIKESENEIKDIKITPENFAELIALVYENKISSAVAKIVLKEMFATAKDPSNIVEEKGLSQLSDTGELEKIAGEIIAANPDTVAEYKSGKTAVLQFFVGQGMKQTKGKANPAVLQDLFKKILGA